MQATSAAAMTATLKLPISMISGLSRGCRDIGLQAQLG